MQRRRRTGWHVQGDTCREEDVQGHICRGEGVQGESALVSIIVGITALRCRLLSTAKHLRQPPIVKRTTSLPQPLGQLRTCHSACHTAELYNKHLMIQTANGESAKSGWSNWRGQAKRMIAGLKRSKETRRVWIWLCPTYQKKEREREEQVRGTQKNLNTELNTAVETALNKHGDKDLEKLFTCLVAAERIGKFVADRTKPRPVRLVFSSLIHRHNFLKFSKDFRQAGFRLDDDLTRSQQAERKSLSLDFQSLKTKGYQPYFRGSLLQYYSDNKNHTCVKGKADRIPAAAWIISCHKWAILWKDICMWTADLL